MVFLDFEVWVEDFKIFDLRFGFLVKSCVDFILGTVKKQGAANLNNKAGLLTGPRGYRIAQG